MKSKRGITLIALIVTIIVLIVLAGISIAMLTGENGILKKASIAKETYNVADQEEAKKLGYIYNEMNNISTTNRGDDTSTITWEIGSNYVAKKYSNGIMELKGKTDQLTMTTGSSSWGGMYYTPEATLNYPVVFTNVISVNLTCTTPDEGVLLITPLFSTNSSVNYYTFRPNANCAVHPVINYDVIGKWN